MGGFRLHEPIRLLPEAHLHRVAIQPAVADDAMLLRELPREHTGLSATGDGRKDFTQRPRPVCLSQSVQTRRKSKMPRCQTDSVEDDERLHADCLFHRLRLRARCTLSTSY